VESNPVLVFGSLLRILREQRGLTQNALAQLVFCSPSLVSAIELGTKPAKLDLVQRIDKALDAHGALLNVWPITSSGNYSSWFAYVAELERETTKIHEWELRVFPGLLQTREYARALMRAVRPRDTDEKISSDADERIVRQEIFTGDNKPMAWFVIDESVFYRLYGDTKIMRDQIIKIEKLTQEPNIIVQVMQHSAVNNAGMEGPLRILEFPDSGPIRYTEGWFSGIMGETKEEVASAMTSFDLIRASALSPIESLHFMARIRSEKYE
jgi:transcriptional regulator with XRE-family HTH domain